MINTAISKNELYSTDWSKVEFPKAKKPAPIPKQPFISTKQSTTPTKTNTKSDEYDIYDIYDDNILNTNDNKFSSLYNKSNISNNNINKNINNNNNNNKKNNNTNKYTNQSINEENLYFDPDNYSKNDKKNNKKKKKKRKRFYSLFSHRLFYKY